ncbi:hypothetical protein [Anaeromyxobacter sp. SG17]|uniref:hypothetical protein n=1 Tax=Anaeromyxobacter sp. SG17 TaxID=2925405 RepID=UPI001F584F6F|nr:hypothetical protein [Anaeromyxobacter sp. SG17]
MKPKVTARQYFDHLPDPEHRPGDIWCGLPTHGLLKWPSVSGIIVTPACDLQNRKVETLTYLPVIPVHAWFATTGFLAEVRAEMNTCLDKLEAGRNLGLPRFPRALRKQDADALRAALENAKASGVQLAEQALARVAAGLRHVAVVFSNARTASLADLGLLFSDKKWRDLRERIVTNALRTDLHFLPCDEADLDWSGVPTHSVVLFRYPMSAPIDVFDTAMDPQMRDWSVALEPIRPLCPGIDAFAKEKPTKRVRLQSRFLADLLTRYIALYSRLGSPDFSEETVSAFAGELGERQ